MLAEGWPSPKLRMCPSWSSSLCEASGRRAAVLWCMLQVAGFCGLQSRPFGVVVLLLLRILGEAGHDPSGKGHMCISWVFHVHWHFVLCSPAQYSEVWCAHPVVLLGARGWRCCSGLAMMGVATRAVVASARCPPMLPLGTSSFARAGICAAFPVVLLPAFPVVLEDCSAAGAGAGVAWRSRCHIVVL